MTGFLQEIRHAVRSLGKTPTFTAVAVLTLGLGIGATTAVYTALEHVVLNPLAYPDAGRLVRLRSAVPGIAPGREWDVSEGAWWFFKKNASAIDEIGAYRRSADNVFGKDGPIRVRTAAVTASALRILGARPAQGRLIDEHDDAPGGPAVAVLSEEFWNGALGHDPHVIGTTISISEQPYQIVGVMPRGFELPPEPGGSAAQLRTDVWLPLSLNSAGPFYPAHVAFRTIARLKPGMRHETAQAELDKLTAQLAEVLPMVYTPAFMQRVGFGTRVYALKDYVIRDVAGTFWILFGAVLVVLAIVYANVANLFLVRAEARRRNVAIRLALGADSRTIARLFVAEALVLTFAGGIVAVVLASWGVDALIALAPDGIPRLESAHPDGSVILFTLGLAVVGALLLAAFPALRMRKAILAGELVEGGRGQTTSHERQQVRSALVVGQVALALMLVVSAGLFIESFWRLRSVDLGIRPSSVVTAQLYLPPARYDSISKMWRFYDAALRRVRALPGVAAAGLTTDLPNGGGFGCTVQGFEDPEVRRRVTDNKGTTCAGQEPTSPGYFEAIGIQVRSGRALSQEDVDQPERGSVVVSSAFARYFWGNEDPIGKGVAPNGNSKPPFYRVVGVVSDVFDESPGGDRALAIYYPIQRIPGTNGYTPNPVRFVVKTTLGDPLSIVPSIRAAIRDVDPGLPLADPELMSTVVDRSMARVSFIMVLLAIAGATALVIAAVGLYGVVSYLVTRRTSEIGVRMALGAQPRDVARLVVGGSVQLALAGVVIGTLAALVATRVLRGLLYGISPTNAVAYLVAAAVLVVVAGLAAYLPASRAARIDPAEALRYE